MKLVYHVRSGIFYPRGDGALDGWSLLWYEPWAADRQTAVALWRKAAEKIDWDGLETKPDVGNEEFTCCRPVDVPPVAAASFLAAAARMRHERFGILFVGSDQGRTDYSAELRALAAALPHGRRVAFLERSDDMPLVYAAGDVAVNASSGQPEAFGRVIPEAQATGRIVVGTAHGGACETIEDGVTGFLVPPGDVDALAARLDAVFDMGRDERSRMQAAAVRWSWNGTRQWRLLQRQRRQKQPTPQTTSS